MSNETSHKKQHYISQCYLRAWCDPNAQAHETPYVWQFPKDGGTPKRKSPKNIFYEKEMYTIKAPDGSRDLTLEHGLQELEDLFVKVRDSKISAGKLLTASDRLVLCAFLASVQARTRSQRDHLKGQWGRALRMMDRMMEAMKRASPEEKKAMRSFYVPRDDKARGLTYEQVKRLAAEPLQASLESMISIETPLLFRLELAILQTGRATPGFITSDAPCVWFDPERYKRPPLFRAPGLGSPTIEVTLPVTPNAMILLNRQGLNGYHAIKEEAVEELNRRTRFHAHEHFVVNMNIKKDIWFDHGQEPEDSWEKQQKLKCGRRVT